MVVFVRFFSFALHCLMAATMSLISPRFFLMS